MTTLTSMLEKVRENVDSYHSEWFETVSDTERETQLLVRLSTFEGVPVFDHLLPELNTRFSSHQKTSLQGLHLVPSQLVKESLATVTNKVLELGQLYEVDLPSVSALISELHSWYTRWKSRMAVLHFLLWLQLAEDLRLLPQHQGYDHGVVYSPRNVLLR